MFHILQLNLKLSRFKVKASKPGLRFLAAERDDAFDALFSTVDTKKLEAPPLRALDPISFSSGMQIVFFIVGKMPKKTV